MGGPETGRSEQPETQQPPERRDENRSPTDVARRTEAVIINAVNTAEALTNNLTPEPNYQTQVNNIDLLRQYVSRLNIAGLDDLAKDTNEQIGHVINVPDNIVIATGPSEEPQAPQLPTSEPEVRQQPPEAPAESRTESPPADSIVSITGKDGAQKQYEISSPFGRSLLRLAGDNDLLKRLVALFFGKEVQDLPKTTETRERTEDEKHPERLARRAINSAILNHLNVKNSNEWISFRALRETNELQPTLKNELLTAANFSGSPDALMFRRIEENGRQILVCANIQRNIFYRCNTAPGSDPFVSLKPDESEPDKQLHDQLQQSYQRLSQHQEYANASLEQAQTAPQFWNAFKNILERSPADGVPAFREPDEAVKSKAAEIGIQLGDFRYAVITANGEKSIYRMDQNFGVSRIANIESSIFSNHPDGINYSAVAPLVFSEIGQLEFTKFSPSQINTLFEHALRSGASHPIYTAMVREAKLGNIHPLIHESVQSLAPADLQLVEVDHQESQTSQRFYTIPALRDGQWDFTEGNMTIRQVQTNKISELQQQLMRGIQNEIRSIYQEYNRNNSTFENTHGITKEQRIVSRIERARRNLATTMRADGQNQVHPEYQEMFNNAMKAFDDIYEYINREMDLTNDRSPRLPNPPMIGRTHPILREAVQFEPPLPRIERMILPARNIEGPNAILSRYTYPEGVRLEQSGESVIFRVEKPIENGVARGSLEGRVIRNDDGSLVFQTDEVENSLGVMFGEAKANGKYELALPDLLGQISLVDSINYRNGVAEHLWNHINSFNERALELAIQSEHSARIRRFTLYQGEASGRRVESATGYMLFDELTNDQLRQVNDLRQGTFLQTVHQAAGAAFVTLHSPMRSYLLPARPNTQITLSNNNTLTIARANSERISGTLVEDENGLSLVIGDDKKPMDSILTEDTSRTWNGIFHPQQQ